MLLHFLFHEKNIASRFPRFLFAAVFAVPAALALSACSDTRQAVELSRMDVRMIARYEMKTTHSNTKVSGKGESTTYLHYTADASNSGLYGDSGTLFSGLTTTQSLALRAAISDACKNSGADILLGTEYEMHTTSFLFFYEHATCTVSGFPAKIDSIEQIPATPSAGTPATADPDNSTLFTVEK